MQPIKQIECLRAAGALVVPRKLQLLLSVALAATSLFALESERTFVFLRPETSSFWRTANGNELTLPIDFPDGATEATLSVKGCGYAASHPITAGTTSFDLVLPAPSKPSEENVYDLTLAFDNGVTNTARFALIQGLSATADGRTRCLAPVSTRKWRRVNGRAVLPIPYGTTSFTLNGVETETGLDGAQGWFPVDGLTAGHTAELTLETDEGAFAASLIGGPSGAVLFIR